MRLLILGCSSRKRLDERELSALERYDGSAFRVLRKFLQTGESDVRLLIVSAHFGVVDAHATIPFYNQRMTPLRARELHSSVIEALSSIFQGYSFKSTFFNLGHDYWPALEGWRDLVPMQTGVVIAQGSSGRRAALLREWLCGGVGSATLRPSKTSIARLGNRTWDLKRDEVLEIARRRLGECDAACDLAPMRFHSWCARVDGRAVAPKWLVSQVTGLPAGAFHTQQACRALSSWGILIERHSLLEGATENFSEKFSPEV